MTAKIEIDQGTDHLGRVYGYDHGRHNFITWGLAGDKVTVVEVAHDCEEDRHGSLRATERAARSVAARENRLPHSRLAAAIRRGRFHS